MASSDATAAATPPSPPPAAGTTTPPRRVQPPHEDDVAAFLPRQRDVTRRLATLATHVQSRADAYDAACAQACLLRRAHEDPQRDAARYLFDVVGARGKEDAAVACLRAWRDTGRVPMQSGKGVELAFAPNALRLGPNVTSTKIVKLPACLTLLHVAAKAGNTAVVATLVHEFRVDIEAVDVYGRTPLHYAMLNVKPAAAEALVVMGADLFAQDKAGQTVLDYARGKFVAKDPDFVARAQRIVRERASGSGRAGVGAGARAADEAGAATRADGVGGDVAMAGSGDTGAHDAGGHVGSGAAAAAAAAAGGTSTPAATPTTTAAAAAAAAAAGLPPASPAARHGNMNQADVLRTLDQASGVDIEAAALLAGLLGAGAGTADDPGGAPPADAPEWVSASVSGLRAVRKEFAAVRESLLAAVGRCDAVDELASRACRFRTGDERVVEDTLINAMKPASRTGVSMLRGWKSSGTVNCLAKKLSYSWPWDMLAEWRLRTDAYGDLEASETLLHFWARQFKPSGEVAACLVRECGYDPNVADLLQRSPLHVAVAYREWGAAETLISLGADLFRPDAAGQSALEVALTLFRDKYPDKIQSLMRAYLSQCDAAAAAAAMARATGLGAAGSGGPSTPVRGSPPRAPRPTPTPVRGLAGAAAGAGAGGGASTPSTPSLSSMFARMSVRSARGSGTPQFASPVKVRPRTWFCLLMTPRASTASGSGAYGVPLDAFPHLELVSLRLDPERVKKMADRAKRGGKGLKALALSETHQAIDPVGVWSAAAYVGPLADRSTADGVKRAWDAAIRASGASAAMDSDSVDLEPYVIAGAETASAFEGLGPAWFQRITPEGDADKEANKEDGLAGSPALGGAASSSSSGSSGSESGSLPSSTGSVASDSSADAAMPGTPIPAGAITGGGARDDAAAGGSAPRRKLF